MSTFTSAGLNAIHHKPAFKLNVNTVSYSAFKFSVISFRLQSLKILRQEEFRNDFRRCTKCRAERIVYKPGDFYDGDEDITVLAVEKTEYNEITILEIKRNSEYDLEGSRLMLLDSPGNIHSIYNPFKTWTDSYYDMFSTIIPIIPEGPIAIYGLAGGTCARQLLTLYPSLVIHGWELDPKVVEIGRKHFDLSDIEKPSDKAGLKIHIGDAIDSYEEMEPRGMLFAAILVDLFSNGVVIEELQSAEVWERIKARLLPDGRVMVNCGGGCVEPSNFGTPEMLKDGEQVMKETMAAIGTVFRGEAFWRTYDDEEGSNAMVFTGKFPSSVVGWRLALHDNIRKFTFGWKKVDL